MSIFCEFYKKSHSKITAIHAPDTENIIGIHLDQLYIGTEQGLFYIFNITDKTLKKYSPINNKLIFPLSAKLADPVEISAIKTHRKKPHRVLIAFKNAGAIIWSMKKKQFSRRITVTKMQILDAEWALENDSFILGFSTGSIAFCSIKGKIKDDVTPIKICNDPISHIFWLKHIDSKSAILISETNSGSIFCRI